MLKQGYLLGVALVLVVLGSAASAETLEFVFRKPSDAKGWKAATQEWVSKKSGYTPIVDKSRPLRPVAVYKETFGDVSVEPELKVNPNNTFGGGPFIRGKIDGVLLSGYVATASFLVDEFVLFDVYRYDKLSVDDSFQGKTKLLCQKEVDWPKDEEKSFNLSAEGDRIELSYRGKLLCSATDGKYESGKIGLINEYTEPYPHYRRVTIETP